MAPKYENELRPKAKEYIAILARSGISGTIGRFFQYHVKIAIAQNDIPLGHVNLYYSPKKQSFKIATNEVQVDADRLVPILERCWVGEAAPVFAMQEHTESDRHHIYVDGSFMGGRIGYGAVIVKDGVMVDELSGSVKNKAMHSMRQVGGEIMAVQYALEWCRQHDVAEVDIFYDYAGVENWPTKRWQAKNEFTQAYATFVQESDIRVYWHKVKSHSGDYWNDRADELAKQGTD
jgi:ribonuclease HI